jgi:site-specific recombinase XerD
MVLRHLDDPLEAKRVEAFMLHCEANLRDSTTSTYNYIIGQLCEWTRKNRPGQTLFDLTEDDCNAFLVRPRGQDQHKPAHNTMRGVETCLKSFYAFCQRRYRTENPVAHWRVRKGLANPKPYDPELVNAAIRLERNPLWKLALLLGMDAGMRRMEIHGIRWEDVRFSGPTEGVIYVRNSKWAKDRPIPFEGRLGRALAACPTRPMDGLVLCHLKDNGQARKGDPFHAVSILHAIQKAMRRVGVTNPSAHRLRHTFATEMLKDGTPIHVTSKLLGHADVKTTVNIYAAVTEYDLRAAVNKRNQYLVG